MGQEELLKQILLEIKGVKKVLTETLDFFYAIQNDENGTNSSYLERIKKEDGISEI